jgi:outer membrane protein OmpA-like peptidoglycan-associated protein/tetratricopeptide (TPR) repeat protein
MIKRILLNLLMVLALTGNLAAQTYKDAKKAGKLAMKMGNYNNVLTSAKEMLTYKPDDATAHEWLATAVAATKPSQEEYAKYYASLPVKKGKLLIEAGRKYYNAAMYDLAVPVLEQGQKLVPKDKYTCKTLAKHFYDAKVWDKAASNYLMSAKVNSAEKNFDLFYAGKAFMEIERYPEALQAFKDARSATKKKEEPKNWDVMDYMVGRATLEVQNEPIRKQLMANPLPIEIENMGPNINTPQGDYNSTITADESTFLITSTREGSFGNYIADAKEWPEDFWIAEKDSAGNWKKAVNLGAPINTGSNEGGPSITADGQTIYFFMSGPKGDGNIYMSTITGKNWSPPQEVEKICSDKWDAQVSISADGNKIFFCSDRDGGNVDIYYANRKRNGNWKRPRKLPDMINTKYSEAKPFIHPDGKTLYFSSEGLGGVGGFDVYKTVLDEKTDKWSKPVNVGYPINTRQDEVGFFVTASGTKAYITSNRDGGYGMNDMYVIYLTGKPKPVEVKKDSVNAEVVEVIKEKAPEAVAATAVTTVVGIVSDEETGEPLGSDIVMDNLTEKESIQDLQSNSSSGKYVVVVPAGNNYAISVSKKGYLFHSENFNIPADANSAIIHKDIKLKKIKVGSSIVLNNIFFETGSAVLSPESELEAQRIIDFMKDQKSVKIEISGHTDNVGSNDANKTLSNNRAKAVVDYLTAKGVDASRLTYKGFGETMPIADNKTEEGRKKNRRTEFKITEK